MNARAIHRCGRRFGVHLAALPVGVEGLRLADGRVFVRLAPDDTYASIVRRVLHVLAYYRRAAVGVAHLVTGAELAGGAS